MEISRAVCFQLITDNFSGHANHCSLCLFLHGKDNDCQHTLPVTSLDLPRTATPFSDCSFYTCRSVASTTSVTSTESDSSSSTIRAKVKAQPAVKRHPLRRRQSPTEMSLRDLHHRQSFQLDLRQQQSEEQLQAVYERQILEYLNSDHDSDADGGKLLWKIDE
jgi:hypothetical protein